MMNVPAELAELEARCQCTLRLLDRVETDILLVQVLLAVVILLGGVLIAPWLW